jgi:hypothetical protein
MMTTASDGTIDAIEAPDDVLALLREQASLYVKLEALAARQQALVTAEDAGPLLAILADRQRLSERLTRVAAELEPVRRRWEVYRQKLSPYQAAEADRLLGDVQQLLRRIMDSDEHDARILSARMQTVAETLRKTHTTSQAISAYCVPSDGAARLDCVDEGAR